MNCATARQHLLGSERPDRPGQQLAAHLTGCCSCRAVQRRLTRLEQEIPRLPVPTCPPPPALFEKVLHGPPLVQTPARLRHNPDTTREGGRQKLALAFALAASLLVFAVAWYAWPRPRVETVSPDRALYLKMLNAKLPPGVTPRQGVEGLTELAEEMFRTAPKANTAELKTLAKQFDWLMRQDLPHEAGKLPVGERPEVLKTITARLQRLESEAARLEAARSGQSAESLRRIALAVSEADRRLRQLSAQHA
jgi:hypothetical protein